MEGNVPEGFNPFEAPGHEAERREASPRKPGAGSLELSKVLNVGFEAYKDNLGPLVGVTAVGFGLVMALYFVLVLAIMVIAFIVGAIAGQNGDAEGFVLPIMIASAVLGYVGYLVAFTWYLLGTIRYSLALLRYGEADFGLVFSAGPWLARGVGAQFLYFLATTAIQAGITLPVLLATDAFGDVEKVQMATNLGSLISTPLTITLFLYWGLYLFAIVDQDAGVFSSFSRSAQITKGSRLSLFVVMLLMGVTSMVGFCACGIGALFSLPLAGMWFSASYLDMIGELDATSDHVEEDEGDQPSPAPAPSATNPYG